jgi:hypothetical protein
VGDPRLRAGHRIGRIEQPVERDGQPVGVEEHRTGGRPLGGGAGGDHLLPQ